MTDSEKAIIRAVISRINDEREGVSPHVREALRVAKSYLSTYAAAPLEILIAEDRNRDALKLARDLAGA